MHVSPALINNFSKMFAGNKSYYGHTILTGSARKNGKLLAKSWGCTAANGDPELSWEMYKNHLEGDKGLGIAPIDINNNCRFGVIDVDDYNLNPKTFMRIVADYNLPFQLFRSKSGGLHIYIFFSEEVKAKDVRYILDKFVLIFGLPRKTEIFPKQERLFNSSNPNWINLPYYGGTDSYMYDVMCNPMGLESALLVIEKRKTTYDNLKRIYEELPLNDGPICLQSLYIRSDDMVDGDGRNNYLFNLGIYYKVSDSVNFEEKLMSANQKMYEPKEEDTMIKQILNPINKKSYSYRCSDHPLCDNCAVELCKLRKFGKGSDEVSSLSFEELKQIKTDPPHYIWIINGHEMVFYKESELRDQKSFADQCMRFLHIVPNFIKPVRWNSILNKAFQDIVVIDVDPEDDLSPGALLWDYFREFILDSPKAQSKEQVKAGYIYKDLENNLFCFKKKRLQAFLKFEKNFNYFTITEIQKRLFDLGVGKGSLYITKGSTERIWYIPTKIMKDNIRLEDDKVSFEDIKPEEGDF